MLMGGVVVGDRVDQPPDRDRPLDHVEEANELLSAESFMQRPMTVPSRTFSAANSVVVPCGFVVMGHRLPARPSPSAARAGCGGQRLDLALIVDRAQRASAGGLTYRPTTSVNSPRERESRELRTSVRDRGVRPCARPNSLHERRLTRWPRPGPALASASSRRRWRRASIDHPPGRLAGGGRFAGVATVLSRRRAIHASCMNRSANAATGFDRPERRTISSVPQSVGGPPGSRERTPNALRSVTVLNDPLKTDVRSSGVLRTMILLHAQSVVAPSYRIRNVQCVNPLASDAG